MDIIVTTPRSQMQVAAREAADCIRHGGGQYFRRFHSTAYPQRLGVGDRVYYVEDGYVRGFAVVCRTLHSPDCRACDSTGRKWSQGFFVFMDAASWRWISPIPMKGFQGFRYARSAEGSNPNVIERFTADGEQEVAWVEIIGGWRDPKPEVQ
jgi:hypothetical protein